jgi:PAS domain S-box-containing protein
MGSSVPETSTDAIAALAGDEYRLILESLPVMIWRCNVHGKCDYVNSAWLAFRGRELGDELGDGWTDGVHPDDLLHCLGTVVDHFYRKKSFEIVYRLARQDGAHRRVLDRRSPYADAQGKFAGFIATCFDVDERVCEAEALRRTEEGVRVLVEDMAEFVLVLQDGAIAYANAALARALGYARAQDLIGADACNIVPAELASQARQRNESILARGSVPIAESRLLCRNGRLIPIESSGKRILYGGRPAVLTIARDVGERRRTEEKLVRLTRELNMAEEGERRRLAQDLHDSVSQTLSLVKLELGAAVRTLGLDPKDSHPLSLPLVHIDEAIRQVRSTTFDLYPAMLDDLGLLPTLRRYAEQFEARTELDVSVSETGQRHDLPASVASFLFRAIKELLSNSAKHATATHVVVCVHWQPDRVRVVVDDDGKGFAITDHYKPGPEHGLGLASIRERTASQAGRFSIESAPGQGTRVVLELPLQ